MDSKWTQYGLKLNSKWTKIGLKMVSKWTLNGLKTYLASFWAHFSSILCLFFWFHFVNVSNECFPLNFWSNIGMGREDGIPEHF